MRIRKRQVPLPLSSLSPIPLSDPLFLPSDNSPQEGRNYHHSSRGPNDATCYRRIAGQSSPAAEAVKRRSFSSNDECDDDDDDKEYKLDVKTKGSSLGNNGGKRRGRGGIGVGGGGENGEGTRCSRVNGRGWRCGQLTLVGYSLCEHHLGKGRLRSMANVRGRFTIGSMETLRNDKEKPQPTPEPSLIPVTREGNAFLVDSEVEDDEKEEDSTTSTRPRKKARSMSSLLGQDENGLGISLPWE